MTGPPRWTRVPAHRATTALVRALYPFMAQAPLLPRATTDTRSDVYIGRDFFGSSFFYDPWTLSQQGLSGPNMLVIGQLGVGKSAFVKSYLWRQLVFGRTSWVIDPKGEYGALAQAAGVTPIILRPGGTTRINPLAPPLPVLEQRELLGAIAAVTLGRSLTPEEATALEIAHLAALKRGTASLPTVVDALLHPHPAALETLGIAPSVLLRATRGLALGLRALCTGPGRGVLDGPPTGTLDLTAPLVVIDLSALGDEILPIVMACTAAWLQAAWSASPDVQRIVVLDEAWRVLASQPTARWLQRAWKLARAHGVQMVAVLHRVSDLLAAGDAGSEHVQLAQGLLEDSETRVVFRQPPGEIVTLTDLLGVSSAERSIIGELPRGVALWKVGRRSFLVEHRLSSAEHLIVDTDTQRRRPPAGASPCVSPISTSLSSSALRHVSSPTQP